ncbi:TetR/AcrR family transcriptional regulator [Arthrobacter sp.]|uniref:TetR/AcrR family transcriptional regulator n=1 Tax=Arthrobacter sp. TaxID=1667 RepID=UPI003A8E8B41
MSSKPNPGGRPRDPAITQALFDAAERAVEAEGFSALTVDSLVKQVGANRPAFYRRFRSLPELVFEIIRRHFGHDAPPQTGSLASDLLTLQRDDVQMLGSDLMRRNLPGLFEAMRVDPTIAELYHTHFISPRREHVGAVIQAAVNRKEISPPTADLEYICDLLFGPLLARLLLPAGQPLDDDLAQATVATALRELHGPDTKHEQP